MVSSIIISPLAVLACFFLSMDTHAHMAILSPAARQVIYNLGLIQKSYTTFDTYPYGMNGNIFGGPDGAAFIAANGYDVCGDDPRRKAFTVPSTFGYAPTQPQMTVEAGKPFDVKVRFTTHHLGWMEFRLCVPQAGQRVVTADTPECFKEHVLRLDAQQYFTAADMPTGVRSVFDFEGTPEAGYSFQHSKCQQGPPGTCCDANSGCSPENANVHRFMLPRDGVNSNDFTVRVVAPDGVSCDRCTLQVMYRTGNSPDSYPETFWNCADLAVVPSGSTRAPTTPTKATTPAPTPQSTQAPSSANTLAPTKKMATQAPSSANTLAPTTKMATQRPSKTIIKSPTKAITKSPSKAITKSPAKTTASPSKATTLAPSKATTVAPTKAPLRVPTKQAAPTRKQTFAPTKKRTAAPSAKTAPTRKATSSPSKTASKACVETWSQCGGIDFTGQTCCAAATDACVFVSEWWSACQPK